MTRLQRRTATAAGAALAIVIVGYLAVIAWGFPIDMDELLPYHPIACLAPSQQLNTFTAGCGTYPISLGPIDFQRAFNYIGATPALLMQPVLAVSSWTGWHLLAGLVALVVAALGIATSIGAPRRFAVAAIVWFPLALATIHDTGPIRIALVTLAWTPALVRVFMRSTRTWVRVAAFLAVVVGWLVSVESKPFFLYLTPGIVVWTLAALHLSAPQDLRTRWRTALAPLVVAGIASLGLLLVMTVDGKPYLLYLMEFGSPNSLAMVTGAGLTFLGVWPASAQRFSLQYPNVDAHFLDVLQFPANVLPVTADRGAPLSLLLLALVIAVVGWLLVWTIRRLWRGGPDANGRSALLWLLAATLALFAGAVASRGGSVHHFVFAQVPVVAAFILASRRAGWSALRSVAVVTGVSVLALAAVLAVPFKPEVSSDIDIVMSAAIERAEPGSVVNCQPWGCYYAYALADRDGVPIVWAETPEQQAQLLAELPAGATVWHVCRDCTADKVEEGFGTATVTEVETTPSGWTLFEVVP